MASVSQLVAAVSQAADETKETVNAYARALIDAELLPKSSGRAVAQVELVHFVRLITALALEPKIKEAAEMTASYLSLHIAGRTSEGDFVTGDLTAEDDLITLFSAILSQDTDPEMVERRNLLISGTVQFVRNFPLIEIQHPAPRDQGGTYTMRYKPVGHRMDIDYEHIRRSTIVRVDLIGLVAIQMDSENWHSVFGEAS